MLAFGKLHHQSSIVNTIDEELSLEIKLQSMLSDILQEPRRKKNGKNRIRAQLKETRKIIDIDEQCSDGDSLGSHHSSQVSSPYDVDTLNEDDAGISSYSPINFGETDEDSEDVVDKIRADWGFDPIERESQQLMRFGGTRGTGIAG